MQVCLNLQIQEFQIHEQVIAGKVGNTTANNACVIDIVLFRENFKKSLCEYRGS